MPNLFGEEGCCLRCREWLGSELHVQQQIPALCKQRTRLHPQQRTHAHDTCEKFDDAQRKAA